jgi:glyoxylase-like metal-dependent hydrolase (beta-lactamase superfamily II)
LNIVKIKNRSIIFKYRTSSGWDLNIHIIRGEKFNYIIDTGLGSLSINPIIEYLKPDNKPIIVINTHHHWDHIWGNGSLRDYVIISHKLCRDMIKSKWDDMLQKNKQYCMGETGLYLPNLVFEKELYFPEDKIRLISTPGHTIDSISVIDEEEKVINVGDNVGDTLDEIVPSIHCEKELYFKTLLNYRDLDFDTCISGHNVILGKQVIEKILSII